MALYRLRLHPRKVPEAPDQCPICKVGKEKFVELVEAEGDLSIS